MKRITFSLLFLAATGILPAQRSTHPAPTAWAKHPSEATADSSRGSQQKTSKTIFDIARTGTLEELKELQATDPEIINTVDDRGFSPLILACYRANKEVAHYLIEHVKDINYRSKEGTALAGVSVRYNKELVEHLLQKNANPNIADETGNTPLFWAVKFGNKELVQLLLDHKANKSLKDENGTTPFEYALITKNQDIINLLKD